MMTIKIECWNVNAWVFFISLKYLRFDNRQIFNVFYELPFLLSSVFSHSVSLSRSFTRCQSLQIILKAESFFFCYLHTINSSLAWNFCVSGSAMQCAILNVYSLYSQVSGGWKILSFFSSVYVYSQYAILTSSITFYPINVDSSFKRERKRLWKKCVCIYVKPIDWRGSCFFQSSYIDIDTSKLNKSER